jgi:predicted  nucleic acid-binding Zn-ribbon protein
MKMMSGGSVSKDSLIGTGNEYVVDLTKAIESDISGREQQKISLQTQLNTEKLTLETEIDSLEQEVGALEDQIKQKRGIISQKRASAGQIAEKYLPQMQEIDLRIVSGKTALSMVIQEMKQFISQIQTVIAE